MATILGNINAALSRVKLQPAKVAPKPLTLRGAPAPAPAKVSVKPLTLRGATPVAAPAGPVHLHLQPLGFHGATQAQISAPPTPVDPNAPPVPPAFTIGGAVPDASGAVSDSGVGGGTDAAAAPSPASPTDTTSTGFQMTPAMWGLGALAALALVAVAAASHHGYDVSDVG